ncbi:MAG TPA: hypothetical protein DEQ61_16735 [Streptomyces sp.]|nr:hypothetical protein [Streptomyces sp.]
MTHRARPRVHLLTGGPAWEDRKKKGNEPLKLNKRQKAAKRKLIGRMADLKAAVTRRDWPAARAARSAAWDEIDALVPDLTRNERQALWQYKILIRAGEDQARRGRMRTNPQTRRDQGEGDGR